MKCPHCDEILPFILCPECDKEIPKGSLYCCWCGNPIKGEKVEIDLSERIPCSDGNCIGTINESGICNICKKPYLPTEGSRG
jgi:hypothetical protein